jgi:hypothetical protein
MQVLPSLNHPHIGAIYGLEEAADVTALVLELVEGPTLADRLSPSAARCARLGCPPSPFGLWWITLARLNRIGWLANRSSRDCQASEGWRRERDSNPRNGFPFSGFQDHRHRPLGHPSRTFRSGKPLDDTR